MGNRASSNELPGISGVGSIPGQIGRLETGDGVFENQRSEIAFYLVTKPVLCRLVALSPSYINKLMAEEGLPHLKIGRAVRFRPKEVVEWLQKRKMP